MDLRKRRSQEKLQIALAHHLQSKTIDEITIGELTKTAGVSRQTFYSNFDSKQSILLTRIENLFEKSWTRTESLVQNSEIGREEFVEISMRNLLEECDKERILMRAAFTGQAGIQCLSLLKSLVSRLISDRILFQFNHNFNARQLDTIADFYAGGIIGTVQGWLLDDTPMKDIASVARQIGRLVPHGLDGYISHSN
ncbi:TetR/AcrR family transcriptional regulator [Arenicella xantha]|uniref:TetR family transcriptional regulator n=1 Tax=Arenicella xantha TaxID=644221 RepID=A0A395JK33_9GAMM|nr:TetR/AcrR family transcriptional regulator [Arenicella xantha]RBP50889.1 TetR family transcriptional regulator [Arenicella xantha]